MKHTNIQRRISSLFLALILATTLVIISITKSISIQSSILAFSNTRAPKPTIVIAGTAHNVAKHLPAIKSSILNVMQEFELAALVFFENDSEDNTLQDLYQWNETFTSTNPTQNHTVLHILSERNVTSPISKIVTLAYARNKVMSKIKQLSSSIHIDYVLLLDMDESGGHLSGVQHCLSLPKPWTVCCGNQYKLYYDLLALSTYDDWMPCYYDDCTQKVKFNGFRHIKASLPPIKVKTCFSGVALYNWKQGGMEQLPRLDLYSGYSLTNSSRVQCEHTSFHQNIQKALGDANFSAYIQPKMLTDGNSGVFSWFPRNQDKHREWERSWRTRRMRKYYDHRLAPKRKWP